MRRAAQFFLLLLPCSFALLLNSILAEDNEIPGKPVDSRIERVLVYANQAIVTRQASVRFEKDSEHFLLAGLPADLADNSVRVRLEGPANPRLLNLEVVIVHKTDFRKEEAKQASEALKKLSREEVLVRGRLGELDRQAQFLRSLQIGTVPDGKGAKPEPMPLQTNAWGAALQGIVEGLKSISEERLRLEDQLDELQSAVTVAHARAERLLSYKTTSSKTVALEIQGTPAAQSTLEVSYLIHGPQWFPRYDIRADLAAGTVELAMDALVRQETGEDWSDAALEFSAAEPSRSADLPKLVAWHIGPQTEATVQIAVTNGEIATAGEAGELTPRKSSREKEELKVFGEKPSEGASLALAPIKIAAESTPGTPLVVGPQPSAEVQLTAGGGVTFGAGSSHSTLSSLRDRAQKTKQKLERAQQLYQSQSQALRAGKIREFQSANGAIVLEFAQDTEVHLALGDIVKEATTNLKRAERLIENQKLADGVVCPSDSSRGYDYKYRAFRRETVVSDGAFTKVSIAQEEVPAQFLYEIVPAITRRAFLVSFAKNPFRSPLLAGPAGIFLGNDFVTQGHVATTSSGEELKLGLGVDEAVAVSRASDSKRDTSTFGKRFTNLHSVNIKVRNDKNRDILAVVMESIPYSQDKETVVKEESFSPKPSKESKGGLRGWELSLKPSEEKTISYAYSVSHPSDFQAVPTPDEKGEKW